jgi:hypothetical protein
LDIHERVGVARRGRDADVTIAASPEHDCRDEHQDSGDPECDRWAQLLQEDRHQQRCEERSEVDDPVERVKDELCEMLRSRVELIAHERCNERLDAARAERDQR